MCLVISVCVLCVLVSSFSLFLLFCLPSLVSSLVRGAISFCLARFHVFLSSFLCW